MTLSRMISLECHRSFLTGAAQKRSSTIPVRLKMSTGVRHTSRNSATSVHSCRRWYLISQKTEKQMDTGLELEMRQNKHSKVGVKEVSFPPNKTKWLFSTSKTQWQPKSKWSSSLSDPHRTCRCKIKTPQLLMRVSAWSAVLNDNNCGGGGGRNGGADDLGLGGVNAIRLTASRRRHSISQSSQEKGESIRSLMMMMIRVAKRVQCWWGRWHHCTCTKY